MSNQPLTNYTPAQADQVVRSMTVVRTKIAELEAERDALKDRLYCNCAEPYLGCQIIGSPTRCERCLKEVGEQGPTLRKENAELRAQVARLSAPVTTTEAVVHCHYMEKDGRPHLVLKLHDVAALIASRTAPAKEPEQPKEQS